MLPDEMVSLLADDLHIKRVIREMPEPSPEQIKEGAVTAMAAFAKLST